MEWSSSIVKTNNKFPFLGWRRYNKENKWENGQPWSSRVSLPLDISPTAANICIYCHGSFVLQPYELSIYVCFTQADEICLNTCLYENLTNALCFSFLYQINGIMIMILCWDRQVFCLKLPSFHLCSAFSLLLKLSLFFSVCQLCTT